MLSVGNDERGPKDAGRPCGPDWAGVSADCGFRETRRDSAMVDASSFEWVDHFTQ